LTRDKGAANIMMDLETLFSKQRLTRSLDHVVLLRGLPPAVIKDISDTCTWRVYEKESTIVAHNDATRDVMMVHFGTVRVVQFSSSGREVDYADIGAGGHFGEIASIDGGPRSAHVVSLTRSVIVILPEEKFMALLRGHPDFALGVMRRLTSIIRGVNIRVRDLSVLKAADRVAVELCRLANAHLGDPSGRVIIKPMPTATAIANRTGTTRETVTRTLTDFARRGYVKRINSDLEILKLDALEKMVLDNDGGPINDLIKRPMAG
jgi:CRP/FNR family cyclic AMP-dependent transcriptional regulator